MKKPLSTPVLAAIGVVVVVVLGFVFFRTAAGPPEFAPPPRAKNWSDEMPAYIKNGGKGEIPGAPPAGQAPTSAPQGSAAGAPK